MSSLARKTLAVLAICALGTVRPVAAQSFVSDFVPASYYQGYGPRQVQMEGEPVQPKHAAAAPSAGGYADGGYEGSGDCSSDNGSCDCGGSCGGGCGGGGCGSCCNPCGRCCNPCGGGWYAGGEVSWVKPFFQHNTAFTTSTFTPGSSLDVTSDTAQAFEYDYETTPRVWIGYECCSGLGVRGRYWQFDHAARGITFDDVGDASATVSTSDLVRGEPLSISTEEDDVLTIKSGLKVQAVDLEGTQRLSICRSDVIVSFGARYARLQQDLTALILDSNSSPTAFLARRQSFEGVGLTSAADVRRDLCCCHLALIGGVRGSILFGQRKVTAFEVLLDDGTDISTLARNEDEVLAIGEIMGGVEWSRCLRCGGRLYSQAVVEGQLWEGAGNATDSDSNLGFLGFGVTAGIAR